MNERDSFTCDAMEKYGGSFVVSLAELARHADPINLAKIKKTWPEYWEQYEKIGRDIENSPTGEAVV